MAYKIQGYFITFNVPTISPKRSADVRMELPERVIRDPEEMTKTIKFYHIVTRASTGKDEFPLQYISRT